VDTVGNRTVVTDTLTIAEGGVPRADIVSGDVDFYNPETGDRTVPLRHTLAFTLTVENFGDVPIRTIGPSSGTHYTSDENFNTLGFPQSSGAWRVGIDFEGNPSYAYPYRWALGNLDELEQRRERYLSLDQVGSQDALSQLRAFVWHGDADETVSPALGDLLAQQWQGWLESRCHLGVRNGKRCGTRSNHS